MRTEAVEKCGNLWRRDQRIASPGERGTEGAFLAAGAEGPGMRACSACAGDYEDPDRTAWAAEEEADPDWGAALAMPVEEFPAEE